MREPGCITQASDSFTIYFVFNRQLDSDLGNLLDKITGGIDEKKVFLVE
jgi:hypothetical protein